MIDVRDLAAWLIDAGSQRLRGVYNATGETTALLDHLETARRVAGHTGPVVRADQHWLLDQGVQPWMGERSLPLWLVDPDWLCSRRHLPILDTENTGAWHYSVCGRP